MEKALLQIYKIKLPALASGGYNWADARDVASAAINAITCGIALNFRSIQNKKKHFPACSVSIQIWHHKN